MENRISFSTVMKVTTVVTMILTVILALLHRVFQAGCTV